MTKAFLHGRTEAIRTVQPESVNFTKVSSWLSLTWLRLLDMAQTLTNTLYRPSSLTPLPMRRSQPCAKLVRNTPSSQRSAVKASGKIDTSMPYNVFFSVRWLETSTRTLTILSQSTTTTRNTPCRLFSLILVGHYCRLQSCLLRTVVIPRLGCLVLDLSQRVDMVLDTLSRKAVYLCKSPSPRGRFSPDAHQCTYVAAPRQSISRLAASLTPCKATCWTSNASSSHSTSKSTLGPHPS